MNIKTKNKIKSIVKVEVHNFNFETPRFWK